MRIDPRLSRLVAAVLSPVLVVQARRTRQVVPILPDARLPWTGEVPGPDPLRLLVLGDSTAAGVGVVDPEDGLGGQLARALAEQQGRGIHWRAVGESGGTARDLIERHLAEATRERFDVVFLSVGANDALQVRSRGAFRRDIRTLLRGLRAANPGAPLIVSSLPAFFRFASLPATLRRVLYLHSRSLEDAARLEIAHHEGAWMSPPPPPYTDGFFAADGFHPSAQGYRDWARFALDDAAPVLR